jgi:hypothetical protein
MALSSHATIGREQHLILPEVNLVYQAPPVIRDVLDEGWDVVYKILETVRVCVESLI